MVSLKKEMNLPVKDNYILQVLLIGIINFALSGILQLLLSHFGEVPLESYPGATLAFIFYDNLLEAVLFTVVIFLFRKYFRFAHRHRFLKFCSIAIMLYFSKMILATFNSLFLNNPYQLRDIVWDGLGPFLFRINGILAALFVYYLILRDVDTENTIHQNELRIVNLEMLKAKAELDSIQSKFNPHFLYNSLNSIMLTIDDNQEKAKEMTRLMAAYFRFITNSQNELFWELKNEMELVTTYLKIEKIRFGNRLDVVLDWNKNTMESYKVPRFIIQPLVENAIKYGTSKLVSTGRLMVKIDCDDKLLTISVMDNGPEFEENFQKGFGLTGTSDKLRLLYGESATIELFAKLNETMKTVRVKLPISEKTQDLSC